MKQRDQNKPIIELQSTMPVKKRKTKINKQKIRRKSKDILFCFLPELSAETRDRHQAWVYMFIS